MPAYQVTYFNANHTVMDSEAIFMKNLTNAKRSAEHHAPDGTQKIEIKDLMDKVLSRLMLDDGWVDNIEKWRCLVYYGELGVSWIKTPSWLVFCTNFWHRFICFSDKAWPRLSCSRKPVSISLSKLLSFSAWMRSVVLRSSERFLALITPTPYPTLFVPLFLLSVCGYPWCFTPQVSVLFLFLLGQY